MLVYFLFATSILRTIVLFFRLAFLNAFQSCDQQWQKNGNNHSSAIADHMTQTGHKIKWDHFDILATGQSDLHCKIKETLLIRDLKPALNENVGSEKLLLY